MRYDQNYFTTAVLEERWEKIKPIVSKASIIGEKAKIASLTKQYDKIAVDCYRNAVNQIVCEGAAPETFMGVLFCDKPSAELTESATAAFKECAAADKAEFAGLIEEEIPDVFKSGEYQLIGFASGTNGRFSVEEVRENDVLLGLASSGINNSGYPIVHKLVRPSQLNIKERVERINATLGDELLKPAKNYVKSILALTERVKITGASYVAEGGLLKSVQSIMPKGFYGLIAKNSFPVLPVFEFISKIANFDGKYMYNTFNMGIGLVISLTEDFKEQALDILKSFGEEVYEIGRVKNIENA
jgi:phosphoribosylformylglycinamidine cyclo-ligase